MSTRVYVAKYTESELGRERPLFGGGDYVAAMREGSAFGCEIENLAGNVLSLSDFVAKYNAVNVDGTLYLSVETSPGELDVANARVLLIFGDHRSFSGDSKMYKDLREDTTWQSIKTITVSGKTEMFATFVDQQFGTNHKKLLVVVGAKTYRGKIKDGFPVCGIWENDKHTSIKAASLEAWIRDMNRQKFRANQKVEEQESTLSSLFWNKKDTPPKESGPIPISSSGLLGPSQNSKGFFVGQQQMINGRLRKWNGMRWEDISFRKHH
jgi:hypothetical protein